MTARESVKHAEAGLAWQRTVRKGNGMVNWTLRGEELLMMLQNLDLYEYELAPPYNGHGVLIHTRYCTCQGRGNT